MTDFSHLDEDGAVHMVDVGSKEPRRVMCSPESQSAGCRALARGLRRTVRSVPRDVSGAAGAAFRRPRRLPRGAGRG